MASICDACGSRHVIEFSTVKHEAFSGVGYKQCSSCGHLMPWHLDEGQHPLVANNRHSRMKHEKGKGK